MGSKFCAEQLIAGYHALGRKNSRGDSSQFSVVSILSFKLFMHFYVTIINCFKNIKFHIFDDCWNSVNIS